MIIANRMTKEPVTATPDEPLSQAQQKMHAGGFRRLPVVSQDRLIGIITDRDLRAHFGRLEQTKVHDPMTKKVYTIGPRSTVEEAAQLMLKHQIGGLPVLEERRLVGIITTTDVMKAFLAVMGASVEESTRLDFVLEGEEHGITAASRVVSREGGQILGVGTYRESLGESPVCYLRVLTGDVEKTAKALKATGFDVLGVHRPGG